MDRDGQPLARGFNQSRNFEKAVSGLKGILHGITVDQKLGDQELLFLDVWLRSQEYLRDDGDLIDLLDLIGDILSDGQITQVELDELYALAEDIIKYRNISPASEEAQINVLLGLLMGIAADGVLADTEIQCLSQWLIDNDNVTEVWPVNVISQRLDAILEDGKVDESERADLLETVKQITGARIEETGIAHGLATEFLEDAVENIVFEGACFCFTGKFVTGGRKAVETSVERRGATTKSNVTKTISYLVIGTLASRDWRFTSHGRKIEAALKLKASGAPITIITERTWLRFAQ